MKNMVKAIFVIIVATCVLQGRGVISAQEADERQRLVDQQRQLSGKLEALKREQDVLVFLKELYVSDSKYLLLDFEKKTGRLKYRNRTLKDLRLTLPKNFNRLMMPRGATVLTRKVEGPPGREALVFGRSFIIQTKSGAALAREDMNIPRVYLARKDMTSLYYAVEQDARAYVVQ